MERRDDNLPKFSAFVQDVIRAHRHDPAVLWWEAWNEPNLKDPYTANLREVLDCGSLLFRDTTVPIEQ